MSDADEEEARRQARRDVQLMEMAQRSDENPWICPDCGVANCRHWRDYVKYWVPRMD